MNVLLQQISGDPLTNDAIIGVTALCILGFLIGVARALSDRTFEWLALDVWVRKDIMGRVVPIILILAFGRVVGTIEIGDTKLALLTFLGLGAAATYAAAAIAGIAASLNTARPNPVPTDVS